jgi:tripeptidyl-peptidase I
MLIILMVVSHLLLSTMAGELLCESVDSNMQQRYNHNTELHVFMESTPQLKRRSDIKKINRMTSDFIHEVTFVIRQRNMPELTKILDDVSDPASMNYGHHMTKDEVAKLTSNPEARDAVVSHLNAIGAKIVAETLNSEYITANASISVWESMFNTQFFMFHQEKYNRSFRKIVRAESYSIPAGLQLHVDGVFNAIDMPPPSLENFGRFVLEEEDAEGITLAATSFMVPSTLRKFYNVSNAKGSSSSTQSIFATIEQYFSPSDLATFQSEANLPSQNVLKTVGGHSSDTVCIEDPDSCAEGNLDVQYIMAASPISPTTYWYTNDDWSGWLKSVANTPNPPLVFSISYGSEEAEVSIAEKKAFNTEAIKLSAMGVTIVAASGDDGAVSRRTRTGGASECSYVAIFPASNPFVTAVGGTSVSTVMHFLSLEVLELMCCFFSVPSAFIQTVQSVQQS